MPIAIGMDQQVQIRGGDGTILWTGTAIVGVMYHVVNSDTAAFGLAEGVIWDATNGVIPRLETTAAGATPTSDLPQTLLVRGKRISAATDILHMGVSLEPIGVGKTGLVAGMGSICSVQTTATLLAIGNSLGGSATAGRVAANTTPTQILGNCFKINTVAAPGTGSTGHAGILINPR